MSSELKIKVRSDAESSADLTDEDLPRILFTANMSITLTDRYFKTVRNIARYLQKTSSVHSLEPVLLESNVEVDILESFPSLVAGYHVRCAVINRNLYITALSASGPHALERMEIGRQVADWNVVNHERFCVQSDGTTCYSEGNGGSPDLLIYIKPRNSLDTRRQNKVIVELEVGTSSLPTMRRDFKSYFADPALLSVVGIKMFGDNPHCPMLSAAAVQWSRRTGGDISVTAVKDFGVEPMSNLARSYFAREMDVDLHLPAVEPHLWEATRHSFVTLPVSPEEACAWIARQDDSTALYDNVPVLSIRGQDLQVSLQNLPINSAPLLSLQFL